MNETIELFTQTILDHEAQIRLSVFIAIFTAMALWEIIAPKRELTQSKSMRWLNNISIVVINSIVIRLLFPAAAVGMAILVEEKQWGLLKWVELPEIAEIIVGVLILDLIIYGQHVVVHHVPLLWRFHRMHHADLDLDVTSGARFHPVEIIFSMLVKFLFIVLLGPSIVAVFIFEVVLNGAAVFNHSNVQMPAKLDKVLRWFIVTPDMHRIHHSIIVRETNSNYGFNFPWWDRLFGTYNQQPKEGQLGMTIGIDTFREKELCVLLPGMLKIPFIK